MTESNNQPVVAVVIPSYNSAADLSACLKSLRASIYPAIKVVVVDNASNYEVAELLRETYSEAVLIKQTVNLGYAGAVMVGQVRATKEGAKYLFVLNQDAVVEPQTLSELVGYLEANLGVAAVQPLILRAGVPAEVNSVGNAIHFLGFGYALGDGQTLGDMPEAWLTHDREVAYASGAAVLIRLSSLRDGYLFSPEFFMYHEDLDLGWRSRLLGWTNNVLPKARVHHRYDFYRSTKIKYEFGERNRLIVLLQNYKLGTWLLILPAWFVMEIGLLFFSLLNGWFTEKIRGYVYVWKNLPQIMSRRRQIQRSRTISDRQILSLFSGKILYQAGPSLALAILNPFLNIYFRLIRHIIFW